MIVAITGGIGCGKSVVSQVLRLLGYPVYDSDSRAKHLMHHSPTVRHQLEERFGTDIFSEGRLQTHRLSALVFSDASALHDLNAIVHPAVRADMLQWAKEYDGITFVESDCSHCHQSGARDAPQCHFSRRSASAYSSASH